MIVAVKHTAICCTSSVEDSTKWECESEIRKVKVSSQFNVCFQNGACCVVEEVDEVISSAHRSTVAKRTTEESDKEKWTKMVWHFHTKTHTKLCAGGKKREMVQSGCGKAKKENKKQSVYLTILIQTHYENVKMKETNKKIVNGSEPKKKCWFFFAVLFFLLSSSSRNNILIQ